MKRWTLGVAAGCMMITGAFVSTASAADNTRLSGSFSFSDSTTCMDPIQVTETYDELMHAFYDNSGNAIRLSFTGSVKITYLDLNTGTSYRPSSSGPATVDLASGQTVLRGGNGAFFDPSGILVATNGLTVLDANQEVISIVGHSSSVCEKLGTAPAT